MTNSNAMGEAAGQLWPAIRALRLVIQTRWKRPTTIPGPVLANVLRGALGVTLRKLVCPEEFFDHDCAPCPLYRDCAYGQVFMPTPPPDSRQLRLQQDLPRPFVIEPPGLHPEERVTSDGLTFRLMLFGSAIERLPYLISTLDRLGADGMGRDRVPFQIERIATSHPRGDETLFAAGSSSVTLPKTFITTDDVLSTVWPTESIPSSETADLRRRLLVRMGVIERNEPQPNQPPAASFPGPRLKIKFLTPLLLKSGSGIDEQGKRIAAQEIRERPPFGVIVRRLRDRLSSLCAFFGERWNHPDFAALGELADTVTLVSSKTTWLTRSRQSTRTGEVHEISGLVGHATYQFSSDEALNALAPMLKFGELIHLGKNVPWGNGAIQCAQQKEALL